MHLKDIVESSYCQDVTPVVREQGFGKMSGGKFKRKTGDRTDWLVFDYRRDRRHSDVGWVGLTVCVGFTSIAKFLRSCEGVDLHNRYVASTYQIGTNVGYLTERKNWFEWQIELIETDEDKKASTALSQEITDYIVKFAYPFFDRFKNIERTQLELTSGVDFPIGAQSEFYLAACYWLNGQHAEALNFTEQRVSFWINEYEKTDLPQDKRRVRERLALLKYLKSLK